MGTLNKNGALDINNTLKKNEDLEEKWGPVAKMGTCNKNGDLQQKWAPLAKMGTLNKNEDLEHKWDPKKMSTFTKKEDKQQIWGHLKNWDLESCVDPLLQVLTQEM